MSAEHTPGPWAVERCHVSPCYHVEAGAFPLGSHICEVGETPREGLPEANASLIAAAPDLLEALRAVESVGRRECWCDLSHDRVQHGHMTKCRKATAAIAKATGSPLSTASALSLGG